MKSLKKLYVTLSFSIVVLVVITTWIGNSIIDEEHDQFQANSEELAKVIQTLQQVETNLIASNLALEDLFLLPNEQTYLEMFFESNALANATLSALIELDWQTILLIKNNLDTILLLVNKIEEIILLEYSDEVVDNVDRLSNEINPIMKEILHEIDYTRNYIQELSSQQFNHLSQSKDHLLKAIILIALLGILIIIGLLNITDKFVLTPLKNLTIALNKEASGEETDILQVPNHIEMKRLIQAFNNMRQQVKLRQSQLEHQALHDELTGLPNRTLLLDRINQFIRNSRRNKTKPAVILMDLDRFKEINDTLGHHVGDTLLQEISRRLLHVLRNLDTIARLGGDEFAILLHDVNLKGVKAITRKITNALAQPFEIENHQLLIRCSQGAAIYPEHGETDADLLKNADIAMYIAKRNQLGLCIYDPQKNNLDVSHISLSADLTKAIEADELELYFQPKVDAKNAKVVSSEALLRWNHPNKGFISPEFIIEVAEQSGLIQRVTEWVIEKAIKQICSWQEQGIDISVGVNLSVFNLRNPKLINTIQSLLKKYNLEPKKLILEVTESLMMLDPELAADVLTKLNEMGLYISIDDFGTGFSSLAYLKNLPVQELKIDRSFVMNIATDKSDLSIVKSTIELAHNLGLSVVAEGVENQESWNILNSFSCDIIQGYHISKPLTNDDFLVWYKSFNVKANSRQKYS